MYKNLLDSKEINEGEIHNDQLNTCIDDINIINLMS
jgi:hypothetical protein